MNENSAPEIFSHFLDVPPPETIASGRSIEATYVETYFKGKKWSELTVEQMCEHYQGDPAGCLSFMTPVAFRYYFPGFMKMALFQYDKADAIFDVVVSKLSIAANQPTAELRGIFEGYSRSQLRAIARYLMMLSENICRFYPSDLAAQALSSYWNRFL